MQPRHSISCAAPPENLSDAARQTHVEHRGEQQDGLRALCKPNVGLHAQRPQPTAPSPPRWGHLLSGNILAWKPLPNTRFSRLLKACAEG